MIVIVKNVQCGIFQSHDRNRKQCSMWGLPVQVQSMDIMDIIHSRDDDDSFIISFFFEDVSVSTPQTRTNEAIVDKAVTATASKVSPGLMTNLSFRSACNTVQYRFVANSSKKAPLAINRPAAFSTSTWTGTVPVRWYAAASADPAPQNPRPVRAHAKKVRSVARMSRAIEPVLSIMEDRQKKKRLVGNRVIGLL
jgi:hypothetical protein